MLPPPLVLSVSLAHQGQRFKHLLGRHLQLQVRSIQRRHVRGLLQAGNALAGALPADKDAKAKEAETAEKEAQELQRKADEAKAKAEAARAAAK